MKARGRAPTWAECEKLADDIDAHPSTVFRWAQRLFPEMKDGDGAPRKTPPKPSGPPPSAPSGKEDGAGGTPGTTSSSPPAPSPSQQPAGPSTGPAINLRVNEVPPGEAPRFAAKAPPLPPGQAPPPGTPPINPQAQAVIDIKPAVDTFVAIVNAHLTQPLQEAKEKDRPPEPPKPISKEESEMLAQAWGPMLAKYGDNLGKYAIEVNAGASLLAVFLPRIISARRFYAYHEAKKERAPSKGPVRVEREDSQEEHPLGLPEARAYEDETLGDDIVAKLSGF